MDTFLDNIFNKRINRETYWAGSFIVIAVLIAIKEYNKVPVQNGSSSDEPLILLALLIIVLIIGIFAFSLNIRRWHDISGEGWMGRTWWTKGMFIYMGFQKGQEETNKYGKPPKPGIDLKILFGF